MARIIESSTDDYPPNVPEFRDEAGPEALDHVQRKEDAEHAAPERKIEAHRIADIPEPVPSMDAHDDAHHAVEEMLADAHRLSCLPLSRTHVQIQNKNEAPPNSSFKQHKKEDNPIIAQITTADKGNRITIAMQDTNRSHQQV